MKLLKKEIQFDTVYAKYQMDFDNSAYLKFVENTQKNIEKSLAFKATALFETFPFSILLNEKLDILVTGDALRKILPDCIGKCI